MMFILFPKLASIESSDIRTVWESLSAVNNVSYDVVRTCPQLFTGPFTSAVFGDV